MSSFTINKDLKLVIGGLFVLTLAACSQEDSNPPPAPTAQTSAPAEEAASDLREGEVPVDIQEPGEGLVITQSHWINEDPIGNGSGDVTFDLLSQPISANPDSWLQYGGDYSNTRHSPIEDLSPENVDDLRFAWGFPTGTLGQFAVSPVVYDDIMYVTSSYNRLFALDAKNGELFWRYDHPQPEDLRLCCGPANRGVAIVGDKILMATLDARIMAFDRISGEILWDSEIIEYYRGFSATSAPLIVKDMAIIGIGGGEYGVRGFFDAYNVNTGERMWRHYTVPDEGEPGYESWSGTS